MEGSVFSILHDIRVRSLMLDAPHHAMPWTWGARHPDANARVGGEPTSRDAPSYPRPQRHDVSPKISPAEGLPLCPQCDLNPILRTPSMLQILDIIGEPGWDRTNDHLIKS